MRPLIKCPLCRAYSDSHSHIFLFFLFSMNLIQSMLMIESFFLIDTSLPQVLASLNTLDCIAIRNLNYLILAITIYELWKERNIQFHNMRARYVSVFAKQIRIIITHKLHRWKFKPHYFDLVSSLLIDRHDALL